MIPISMFFGTRLLRICTMPKVQTFTKTKSPNAPLIFLGSILSKWVAPESIELTRFPQADSTDDVLSSLCPTGWWSGAGVGIKMLMGIPLPSAN